MKMKPACCISRCRGILADSKGPLSLLNVSTASNGIRFASLTGHAAYDRALNVVTGGRIETWLQKYEDLVGLTEVKEAQNKVIQAEQLFQQAQTKRRELQHQVTILHSKLKELHSALDKVQRGEERYLALLTEEYDVLREEKRLGAALSESERCERDRFTALSSAVRESHERERGRAERTKYWSIFGSVIGATIGIVGSSINNYLRNRELRSLVRDSAAGGIELNRSVSELTAITREQHADIQAILSGSALSAPGHSDISSKLSKDIIDALTVSDNAIVKEIADIKRILAALSATTDIEVSPEKHVVYVGPELKAMLAETESGITEQIQKRTLLALGGLYIAAITTAGLVFCLMHYYS